MSKIAIVNSVQFVHAKLWIFDDTVALVGSANSNRRGYAHDSEIAVAFGDITEAGATQALRTVLWNAHLGTQAAPANAAPAASIGVWKSASTATGARVNQYAMPSGNDPNPTKGLPFITPEQFWDEIVDPDCP